MTFDEAKQAFRAANPGIDPDQNNAAFNNWSGQNFPNGGWEGAPPPAPVQTGATSTGGALSGLSGAVNSSLLNLANQAGAPDGNSASVQGGGQTGSYTTNLNNKSNVDTTQNTNTTGRNVNTGSTITGGNQTTDYGRTDVGASGGLTTNEGGTTGSTTGSTTGTNLGQATNLSSGTNTTTAADPYGLSALIGGAKTNAQGADATRIATLTNLAQNGDPALQQQVQQAVSQSLSGPGMSGAGDNARGRAAGSAATDVGLRSAGLQLNAANSLAGGSAAGSTAQQFSPFVGTTSSNTGQNTGTSSNTTGGTSSANTSGTSFGSQLQDLYNRNTSGGKDVISSLQGVFNNNTSDTTGTQNTTGNQSTTGSSNTSGTAAGDNWSAGGGKVPTQTNSGGGSGCYVCTALVDRGMLKRSYVERAIRSKLMQLSKYEIPLHGYMLYGPALAWLVLHSTLFARLMTPIAKAVLYAELRLTLPLPFCLFATLWHALFTVISIPFGLIAKAIIYPRSPTVMQWLLEKHNLNFKEVV